MADRPLITDGGDNGISVAPRVPVGQASSLPPPRVGTESVVDAPSRLPEGSDCGPDVLGVDESPGHPGFEFNHPAVIGSTQPSAISTFDDAPAVTGSRAPLAAASGGKVRIGDR